VRRVWVGDGGDRGLCAGVGFVGGACGWWARCALDSAESGPSSAHPGASRDERDKERAVVSIQTVHL
jgi:hypothetical protein